MYAEICGCSEAHARDQLRDFSGLESALARPASYAHYEQADLSLQAAALAHGLGEGQLFIEGNKRVALAALHTFLLVNGLQIDASQEERARWIVDLAAPGRTADEKVRDLAARLRRPCRILMSLMKVKVEKEKVHRPGERLLGVG